MIMPEDVSEIKTINSTLGPNLEALEKIVRAFERDAKNEDTIKELNKFSRDRGRSASFINVMLGLIGTTGSYVNTIIVFDQAASEALKTIKNATKISTLKISIPSAAPDLIQLTEKFKTCGIDDASKKLCVAVVEDLNKLQASVGEIRKKFNLDDEPESKASFKP